MNIPLSRSNSKLIHKNNPGAGTKTFLVKSYYAWSEVLLRIVVYVIAALILLWAAVYSYLRFVFFYRDPVRIPEARANVIIAPCDGQVVYLERIRDGKVVSRKLGQEIEVEEITKADLPKKDGWLIGIYMSPLDVHFNYAPIAGKINKMVYTDAKLNLPMVDFWEYVRITWLRKVVDLLGKKYHLENERNTIFIEGDKFTLAAVEIADKFVSKITLYVKEQEELELGQKMSFIERGSQVDLAVFYEDIDWKVKVGDQVYGGQTAIATY